MYKPKNFKERANLVLARALLALERRKGKLLTPPQDAEVELYASEMTARFNWIHDIVFPRFFEKIHVDAENLERVRELSKEATIVYVTKDIGQLEYNFFNYLFLSELLPLARFVNELSLWQWLPFKTLKTIMIERARRFSTSGRLPHPVSSGYLGALIDSGRTAFIRLKTTEFFDDLYWYSAETDPLASVIAAAEGCHPRECGELVNALDSPVTTSLAGRRFRGNDTVRGDDKKPIYIVPLHFIWDKRPEGSFSFQNFLPGGLRKFARFIRNYKNRAVAKVGEPINLAGIMNDLNSKPFVEKARELRRQMLEILRQEKRVVTGPALKPRSWVINELMEDDGLQKEVCDLSVEKKTSIDDVRSLARKYAGEIAADVNYTYLENASRIMQWVIKNIYDGIDINADGLAALKKAAVNTPIILVPNHRSHMDYLILTAILYENNVTIPHVAAGMNLSFWPMGRIFRKCGAFFMRRKFAGNRLYRAAFKAYLKVLLKEGYCQEFFIEGGRTRTGKLLRPKTGMLTMLTEAVREGAAREAFFIPVSIAYDRVIEQYKKEISGEAKKGERTRDLLRLPRVLTKKYGKIYVRFGEPISYTGGVGDVKACVLQAANAIAASINKGITVTPASIAASALLLTPSRGITAEAFDDNAAEIIKYLKWKGAAFSKALEDGSILAMHDAAGRFLKAHNIILHKEFQPACYEIKEDERVVIDYYKNNIIHFFISASCVAAIILAHMRRGVFKPAFEDVREWFSFCKDLFTFEFAFSTRLVVDEHVRRIMDYFEREGISANTKRLECFKAFGQNYFEAYLVVLNACCSLRRMEEQVFLKTLAKYARHLHLLGRVTRVEGISAPIFKNALLFYTNLGILSVETDQKGRNIYTCGEKAELAEKVKLKLEELC